MKKTGLLFGTFNPIHNSHLVVAASMAHWKSLEEIWFVVTPHNPHKDKSNLLDDTERLHLVKLATEGLPGFKACAVEFDLPQPNYTIDTLRSLTKQHPDRAFHLLMGADNLLSFPRWKDAEGILSLVEVLVYPRPGAKIPEDFAFASHPRISVLQAPMMEQSATQIRAQLGLQKEVNDDLPGAVAAYIQARQLYRS